MRHARCAMRVVHTELSQVCRARIAHRALRIRFTVASTPSGRELRRPQEHRSGTPTTSVLPAPAILPRSGYYHPVKRVSTEPRMRHILRLVALILVAACFTSAPPSSFPVVRRDGDAPVYELRNGRWFDGTRFVAGTRYTVYGALTARRPATIDSVIDLAGGWVIPALGE